MYKQDSVTLHSNASESILTFQLSKDKAELILIALNALYEAKNKPDVSFEQTLTNGQKTFGIETLPDNLNDVIAKLCDEIYMPVYRLQFPLTANDYLMKVDIDIDNITDIEMQHIIHDIETQHGIIDLEAL